MEDVQARNVNAKKYHVEEHGSFTGVWWVRQKGEEPSLSLMSVHCKLFHHGERLKKNSMIGRWCGACGAPYDWTKSNRLLTLRFGDKANQQVVFPAHSAPDGECDNMISALKVVKNLISVTILEKETPH